MFRPTLVSMRELHRFFEKHVGDLSAPGRYCLPPARANRFDRSISRCIADNAKWRIMPRPGCTTCAARYECRTTG